MAVKDEQDQTKFDDLGKDFQGLNEIERTFKKPPKFE